MKKNIIVLSFLAVLTITISSCKKEFLNPNNATETEILKTREGLFNASVGLKQYYTANALGSLIITTGCTSREIRGISTFQNVIDLELGGSNLPNDNSSLNGLFFSMMRTMRIADDIIANAGAVFATDDSTRNGILANAYYFKALAVSGLATCYEKVAPSSNNDGKAIYIPRIDALKGATQLLTDGLSLISSIPPSVEFNNRVIISNFSLVNCMQALKARMSLMAGDYTMAFNAANAVSALSSSKFTFTSPSINPVWSNTVGTVNYRPRDNFGLPIGLYFTADGRSNFHLGAVTPFPSAPAALIENLRVMKSFYTTNLSDVPVYIPDEMKLIKAECILRNNTLGSLTAAVAEINAVRTQSTGDAFLINAALPAYSGTVDVPSLLNEVYANRCAELFMQGLRLEDSRRFGRPAPSASTAPTLANERTRNYYDYPQLERSLNPNTPLQPAI
jgi:starch-binding outer membrane protein, SusD/RagB family